MVTAIVSHPKSVFDVLACKNSPTLPIYYGTAHLPACRAHRSLLRGKAKAMRSPRAAEESRVVGDASIGRSGVPRAFFMPLQPQDCELFVRIVLGTELILRTPV